MRANKLRGLRGAVVAPFLLLLCVTALSPSAARAQARREVDRTDENTRSVDNSSSRNDSSSSSTSSSSSASSSSSTSSSSSDNSSSSSSSSSDTSSSTVNHDSGSSVERTRSDEGRRGGGNGKADGEGRNRQRDHPGWGRAGDLDSRKRDPKDKDKDSRDKHNSYEDKTWTDDPSQSTAQSDDRDECERGLDEGRRTGASDARRGQSNDPLRSRHYKRGGGGIITWGRSGAAKQAYRDCFLRGYEEGYRNPNLY